MSMLEAAGSIIIKYIGRPLAVLAGGGEAIFIATLSTAEVLLKFLGEHLANDITTLKEHALQRSKASADAATADAQKRLAEAAQATNIATLHKRDDAIANAELQAKLLQNDNTAAQIAAVRKDAETRRLIAIADARAKLLDAIAKVRQQGGDIFFNEGNLREILSLPRSSHEDPEVKKN